MLRLNWYLDYIDAYTKLMIRLNLYLDYIDAYTKLMLILYWCLH